MQRRNLVLLSVLTSASLFQVYLSAGLPWMAGALLAGVLVSRWLERISE